MPAIEISQLTDQREDKSLEQVQEELVQRWPARKEQIHKIIRLIGRPSQLGTSFFVSGSPKTGKTSIIRDCLASLGRQHAYFEVGETTKTKQLLGSVLSQLYNLKRKRDNGFEGIVCADCADFMLEAPKACPPDGPTAFVVLDAVQQLVRAGPLLRSLLRTRELTGANITWVLVSGQPWASRAFLDGCGAGALPVLTFPAYHDKALAEAVERVARPAGLPPLPPTFSSTATPDSKEEAEARVWPAFVGWLVPALLPHTRLMPDMMGAARALWLPFIGPLRRREVAWNARYEKVVMALTAAASRTELLADFLKSWAPGLMLGAAQGSDSSAGARVQLVVPDARTQHLADTAALPLSARLLLVAAYLASHNKASSDKAVFDVRGRSGRMRGRNAALGADRQMESAIEAKLKGPSPFSLNRVLNIYSYLYASADHGSGQGAGVSSTAAVGTARGPRHPTFVVTQGVLAELDAQGSAVQAQAGLGRVEGDGKPSQITTIQEEEGEGEEEQAVGARSKGGSGGKAGTRGDAGAFLASLAATAPPLKRGKAKAAAAGGAGVVAGQGALGAGAAALLGLGSGAGTGLEGVGLQSQCAHLPHHAGGTPRHGATALASPESAELLSTLASLVSMGLLLRSGDDVLEAPRFCVAGGVSESFASHLAQDCGLALPSYLKYA